MKGKGFSGNDISSPSEHPFNGTVPDLRTEQSEVVESGLSPKTSNFVNNHSRDYRIIPLSNEILDEAVSLIEAVFPYKTDQKKARRSFTDSLSRPDSDKQYWLAVNHQGSIVGITGLYDNDKDSNVVWLGWFGVHPQHRRHGLGSMLLEFAISEAIKRGFSVLKLYSSFDENERAAHHLYEKSGFVQTKSDEKTDKIYFAKKLKEQIMVQSEIKINWTGPFTLDEVIENLNDGGEKENNWESSAIKHPTKKGRVTIAGHPGDDLAPGTLNSILKQAKLKEVK